MTSVMPSMNPISYSSLVQSGSKVYVPVPANEVVYTQFDHVAGYAIHGSSGEDESASISGHFTDSGVPVSKIKILNTLIDQLVSIKTDRSRESLSREFTENTELSENQLDSLIKDYQNKIEDALNAAKGNPFAFDGTSGLQTGLVLNAAV